MRLWSPGNFPFPHIFILCQVEIDDEKYENENNNSYCKIPTLFFFGISQGTYYEWQYLTQTGFVSTDLKNQVNAACDWASAAKNKKGALSLQCVKLLNDASAQISNVNMYNIYGDW